MMHAYAVNQRLLHGRWFRKNRFASNPLAVGLVFGLIVLVGWIKLLSLPYKNPKTCQLSIFIKSKMLHSTEERCPVVNFAKFMLTWKVEKK